MGDAWKARDTVLDRHLALKVSKAEFTQEARAMAAFSHPNVCQIYDVGSNYIVMEPIDGVQLAGPLTLEKAVAYVGQILDALDATHRKFTHRDLKPANVMLPKQGGLNLLDFGLAKQQPTIRLSQGLQVIRLARELTCFAPRSWQLLPRSED
jgi:serine/threonine protein kinase